MPLVYQYVISSSSSSSSNDSSPDQLLEPTERHSLSADARCIAGKYVDELADKVGVGAWVPQRKAARLVKLPQRQMQKHRANAVPVVETTSEARNGPAMVRSCCSMSVR